MNKSIKKVVLGVSVICGIFILNSSISLGVNATKDSDDSNGNPSNIPQVVSDKSKDEKLNNAINRIMLEGFTKEDAIKIISISGTIELSGAQQEVIKLRKQGKTWEQITEALEPMKKAPQKRELLTKEQVLELYNQGNCLENIFRAQDMYLMGKSESVEKALEEVNRLYPADSAKRGYEENAIKMLKESKDMKEYKEKVKAAGGTKAIQDMTPEEIQKLKDDFEMRQKQSMNK